MYNLYTFEKRKKTLENENMKNLFNSKEYIKKRDKLAKKFYSKINNFLFEMAKKPIIIKNNYYISNENNNYSFQRPKFQTDRERIEKLINSQKQYQYHSKPINLVKKDKLKDKLIINDINKNNDSSNNNNTNNSTELIYHPSDQSNHPPNDLEKILDTIYLNQDFENKKKEDFKDTKEYNLMKAKKKKYKEKENNKLKPHIYRMKRDMSYKNLKDTHNLKHQFNFEKQLFKLKRENKSKNNSKINLYRTSKYLKKDEIDNDESYKTYFNSIQQAIVCKAKEGNNNNSKDFTKRLMSSASAINFKSPKSKKFFSFGNIEGVNNMTFKKNLGKKELNNQNNISYSQKRKEIIEKIMNLNNPPLYDKHFQKIKKKDFNIIKQMAIENVDKYKKKFKPNKQDETEQTTNRGFFSNYEISDITGIHSKITNIKNKIIKKVIIEDENLILYNNCVYYKNDQDDMNKLGKIILQKCHFVNNKFYKNENNKLQKGQGKLMITNGLSINEFIDKYSLPNLVNKNIS